MPPVPASSAVPAGARLDRGEEIVGRHAGGGGRVRLAHRCLQAYQRCAVYPAHLPEHAGLIDLLSQDSAKRGRPDSCTDWLQLTAGGLHSC